MFFDGTTLKWQQQELFADSYPCIEIDGTEFRFERVETLNADGCCFYFRKGAIEWQWQWRFDNERLVVHSTLKNASDQALSLGKITWIDTANVDLLKRNPAEITVLETPYDKRGYYRQIKRLSDVECMRTSARFAEFFHQKAALAVQLGFLTFQKCLNYVCYENRLQATSDYAGWVLDAGKSIECDVLTVAVGHDPMAQLEEWATRAAAIVKPCFRHKPALGYLGWAWIDGMDQRCGFSEELALANAQAIREKLSGFGFEYVWISLANIPGGNPGAYTGWNYNHFPSGPKALVEKLAAVGMKLGLWVGPYLLSSHLTDKVQFFADAILKNEKGEPLVYYPVWSHGDAGRLPLAERPQLFALDPSHPKVLSYLNEVFTKYREEGIRYYMLDFLEAGCGALLRQPYLEHHDKSQVASAEVFVKSMQALRQVIGDDTYILTSTGPLFEVSGIADGVRVGNDFGEGRPIAPDSNFYPASFVINGSFTAASQAVACAATSYYLHGKLFWNDSGNVLTVDQPIPLEAARIHATIHALSGSSSMLGDDLRYISPERLSIIKKTLPRSEKMARPLDLFDTENWPPHCFIRHVQENGEDFNVIVIYNFSSEPYQEHLDLSALGYAESEKIYAWEFWTESYAGSFSRVMDVCIPPESVRVFRLNKWKAQPFILGTDMHVLMGENELANVSWNAEEGLFSFTARRPQGEVGSVFMHLEENTHIEEASCMVYTARNRDGVNGDLVVRIPLCFDEATCACRLKIVRHNSIADDKFM